MKSVIKITTILQRGLLMAMIACPLMVFSIESASTNNELISDSRLMYQDKLSNISSIEVIAEEGSYYAEFWLLPAKYPDGKYSVYTIYLNDERIGTITPSKGNWQSARIDGNVKLDLKRGKNIISISTPAPEIPNVEFVKIARTDLDAEISSVAYDRFHEKSIYGSDFDILSGEKITISSVNNQLISAMHYENVPLKYTFCTLVQFTEGQEIFIASTGEEPHAIDMMYYGTKKMIAEHPTTEDDDLSNVDLVSGFTPIGGDPIIVKVKQTSNYEMASSDEMQGYNWKGLSKEALNSTVNTATLRLTIPKTGTYLIRLRHKDVGMLGVVDLNVNGKYIYEEVPISYSWVSCVIPADGACYGTMTFSTNPGKDDPMLFIHGAAGDRIVGYNDDGKPAIKKGLGLTFYDAYFSQIYKVKTSGVSVSNYSSNDPESTCEIIAGIDEMLLDPELFLIPAHPSSVNGIYKDNGGIVISSSLQNNGTIQIVSEDEINRVDILDLSGVTIKTLMANTHSMEIEPTSIGVSNPGIYIMRVQTEKYEAMKKITVY